MIPTLLPLFLFVLEQDLESIGGPKEVALYRACCYYYMQMFDKVIKQKTMHALRGNTRAKKGGALGISVVEQQQY